MQRPGEMPLSGTYSLLAMLEVNTASADRLLAGLARIKDGRASGLLVRYTKTDGASKPAMFLISVDNRIPYEDIHAQISSEIDTLLAEDGKLLGIDWVDSIDAGQAWTNYMADQIKRLEG